jgi:ATP-dependent DNA helicase RecG
VPDEQLRQLQLTLARTAIRRTELIPIDEIFERADQPLLEQMSEDRRYERKPAGIQAQALGDYMSLFANTAPDGGIIAIGIDDNGSISGCLGANTDHLNGLERAGDIYCGDARYAVKRVPVRNAQRQEDFVLLIRVRYRNDKVVETSRGEAFIRRGESKKRLSDDEKRELRIGKGEIDLEQEPCGLDYPDDFDLETVHQFADNFRRNSGVNNPSDRELLEVRRLGRMRSGQFVPNIACAALFAKDPTQVIPGCRLRFLRFEGVQEGTGTKFNAIKDMMIEGNIPRLITQAEKVIESQVRDFTRLGPDGKFFTASEYPKEAWYEAIVNACVHRSYNLKNMNVFVKMFDDRLEVESPGGFPPLVTPENIYDMHAPRNPKLMDALFVLDLCKCAHEGTRRMRDTMNSMNLPDPEFKQKEVGAALVRVTLRNNIAARKVFVDSDAAKLIGEAVFRTLSEPERQIINFLAENKLINVSEVQRLTGRSWQSARRLLGLLTVKGIIEHIHKPGRERDPQAFFVLRDATNKTPRRGRRPLSNP